MTETVIIVPARLDSQRFPRKLLYPVGGRPLILWTAANLRQIAGDTPFYFAVADNELEDLLASEGYRCIRTDPVLPSGTDRIAAANRDIGAKRVINIQADEPILQAVHVAKLVELLDSGMDMATLATRFEGIKDFRDPNKVKVVMGRQQKALYFSRSPIPYNRDTPDLVPESSYWHMGVYAYTAALLEDFTSWPVGQLEGIERLEQLRVLENGKSIGVGITEARTVGIDVPEDIPVLERHLSFSEISRWEGHQV